MRGEALSFSLPSWKWAAWMLCLVGITSQHPARPCPERAIRLVPGSSPFDESPVSECVTIQKQEFDAAGASARRILFDEY
jgi:hypothetical protein